MEDGAHQEGDQDRTPPAACVCVCMCVCVCVCVCVCACVCACACVCEGVPGGVGAFPSAPETTAGLHKGHAPSARASQGELAVHMPLRLTWTYPWPCTGSTHAAAATCAPACVVYVGAQGGVQWAVAPGRCNTEDRPNAAAAVGAASQLTPPLLLLLLLQLLRLSCPPSPHMFHVLQ